MTRSSFTRLWRWPALAAFAAAMIAAGCSDTETSVSPVPAASVGAGGDDGGTPCTGGLLSCDGMCTDLENDPANCGACGVPCMEGEVCSLAFCVFVCAGGTTKCGETCADTNLDPANCGACGHACGAGEVCSVSTCGLECVGGTTECGGACVETQVDAAHCGGCGNACDPDEVCSQGVCGLVCFGGTLKCGDTCVDAQLDIANCGGCAVACPIGEVCSQGVCGVVCEGGTTKCGDTCVDAQLDPANCGACANACGPGEVCSQGMCGLDCYGGSTKCGNACVDTQLDPAHCGVCANACSIGEVCSQGTCGIVCLGGTTMCGAKCVDTQIDPANCSGCDKACGPEEVCSQGICVLICVGGTTKCGNACVDTQIDPAHCGSCATACTSSQVCSSGACGCPVGQVACGNACVNPSDNSLHCGACGNACPASQVCSSGVCMAVALGNGKSCGGLSGLSPPKVAVCGGTSNTDLQTKLNALSVFTAVDHINMNASPPSVATLSQYDAVVAFTFLTVSFVAGDNLATYLELGGGVVLADYQSQDSGAPGLKGRYETDYTMSTQINTGGMSVTKVTLGNILEPASPLLSNVSTFGIQGTNPFHLPTAQFNKNAPVFVALWSDGNPAIIRGNINGHDVVEINTFGSSSTASPGNGWDATTDGAKVYANALFFVIPLARFTVAKQLDFGVQPLSTPTTQTVTYTNVSAFPQTITALTLSGTHIGDFSAVPPVPLPATIPSGGSLVVDVRFDASGIGLRAARLSATVTGCPVAATTLLTGIGQ